MTSVTDVDQERTDSARFIVQRNQSLSWRGNKLFLLYVGTLTIGIASIFALQGAWLILPFAGVEILVLAICLYICCIGNRQKEVITINDTQLIVEIGTQQPSKTWKFDRAWVQLELQQSKYLGHPNRLLIRAKGKQTEVGECLTNKEKMSLVASLRTALHSTTT